MCSTQKETFFWHGCETMTSIYLLWLTCLCLTWNDIDAAADDDDDRILNLKKQQLGNGSYGSFGLFSNV